MKKKFFGSFIVLFLLHTALPAQDNRGTDFWVCFPQNAKNEFNAGLNFRLYITGEKETRGTVTIPGLGIAKTFFLTDRHAHRGLVMW